MTPIVNATLLFDRRVGCYSLMTAVMAAHYLKLVESSYAKRGGLKHQRDVLKTTTAKRIRRRMVSDVKNGAILPPVVVGVVTDVATFETIPELEPLAIMTLISESLVDSIAIIDGMQRTTALRLAMDEDPASLAEMKIRVECWIAKSPESLIYRMLVLNTGQVPWNLSRQLQVVYSPLIDEMKKRVTFERVLDTEKPERRARGGEYQPDSLVELYIAFGVRKTDVDTQETLADEFSRLDMTDALAEDQYDRFFYPVLQMMVDIDQAFSRLDSEIDDKKGKIEAGEEEALEYLGFLRKGKSIFDSKPARIGFIVAAAISVLGRLGMERSLAASSRCSLALKSRSGTPISAPAPTVAAGARSRAAIISCSGRHLAPCGSTVSGSEPVGAPRGRRAR